MIDKLLRWRRSALDVRPGERLVAGLMFTYGFLVLTAFYVIKPVRNSVFVDRVGADQLPFVYILTALFVIGVTVVYSRYVDRIGKSTLILGSLGVLGAILGLFWWLLRGGSSFWSSGAFYIFGKLFPLLLVSQFWLVANLLFTAAQARRIFGPIGVGLILGGIAGSTISGTMADLVGSENLLLLSIAILGLCGALVWHLSPRMAAADDRSARLTEDLSAGAVKLLRRSSHLRTIALILGLTIVVGTLIDWQFNRAVELYVEGEDAKTAFFGTFFAGVNVISVVVQLVFTGWVLRRLGLQVALLVLPVGITVASVGILAVPALAAVSLAKGTEGALRHSLDQATRELLYLPVPTYAKYKVKPLIDLAVYRGGTGIGGILLLLAVNVAGFSIRQVSVLTLIVLALWIVVALRMRREFGDSLKRLIGVRDVKLEELILGHLNAETVRELARTLRNGNEQQVRYALALLQQVPSPELLDELAELLHHEDEEIRRRAVSVLSELRAEGHADEVTPLLQDPSLDVRSEAIRYICEFGPGDPARTMEEFLAEKSEVRIAAVGCLLRYGRPEERQRGLEVVRALARSDDPDERRTAAALLGRLEDGTDELFGLLSDLIRDPDMEVCHRAMRAAGSSRARELVPLLLDRLEETRYRRAARHALESFGSAVHPDLLARMADPETGPATRSILPGLLVPDAEQETVDRLAGLLPELTPPVRFEALKALNKLRRSRPDLEFDAVDVDGLVEEAVERAYEAFVIRQEAGCDDEPESRTFLGRTLTQRHRDAVERAFRALGLQADPGDLYAAFVALGSPDALTRQRGFELLDTVVPVRLRTAFDPLVNPDAGSGRVLEEGRERLKLEPRESREALEALVEGDDPWVSLLAHRSLGRDGMPPGRTGADLAAHMRTVSPLADRTSISSEQAMMMEIVERAEHLSRAKIFNDVRSEDLAGLAALVEERTFDANGVIFDQGEAGGVLYVVIEGRIEARKDDRVLFEAGPGRSVGSLSLLDGLPTDYRATALEPTRTLALTRGDFAAVMEERKPVARSVISYLTGVVRGMNEAPEGSRE